MSRQAQITAAALSGHTSDDLEVLVGVIWGEHVPEGRGHDVERVIVEGQLSRVTDHPLHLDSRLRCAVASGGEPGVGDV